MRVAVVFNPAAGGRSPAPPSEIREALARRGLDVRWAETTVEDPGAGVTRAMLREGVDLVMACGGDGTIMSCVTGLAGTGVPLALLPAGTGNLLANNFDIPRDLEGAIDVALDGGRCRIDVGAFGADRFVIMSGIGFDAAIVRDANPRLKDRFGALAYVLSGLRHLREPPAEFRILLDDAEPIVRRGRAVLVGNVGRLQGGLRLMPGASPTDGLLDVGVLRTWRLRDWLALTARLVVGKAPSTRQLERFRARRVEVTSDPPQPVERDGDVVGTRREFAVEIVPQALTLCTPRRAT